MGFMAGFGSAFADSFKQQEAITADRKADAVKMRFTDYMSRRDEQVKQDKSNAQAMKLAKSIVASTGQPQEAVGTAYEILANGGSEEQVWKQFRENQAVVTPKSAVAGDTSGPADPRDALTTSAQTSVDAQMKQSGMTPPADGQGIFGRVKDALAGHSQERGARDTARADQQIADATGQTTTQVQDTMSGKQVQGDPVPGTDSNVTWTPKTGTSYNAMAEKANNLNDALALQTWTENNPSTPDQKQFAKALVDRYHKDRANSYIEQGIATGQGTQIQRGFIRDGKGGFTGQTARPDYSGGDASNPTWMDDKGNVIPPEMVAPVGKDQETDMKAVADEGSEAMKPYQEEKVRVKDFIRTSHDYVQLLKNKDGSFDSKAMDIAGNASQFVDRWRRAGLNIADLIMPKGDIEDTNTAIGELNAAEKKVRNQLASGKVVDAVAKNAMKASLIDIQGTKLAYQMAAQANGSTKGVSNVDFKNYRDIVSGNGNPATAAKALATSIKQAQANVGDMEKNIKTGKGKTSYYAGKYNNAPNGFDMGTGFDAEAQSDPELSKALKDINYDASTDENPGAQVNTAPDAPDWAQKSTKPLVGLDGQEVLPGMWKYMSPALQEAVKKKNGL